MMIWLTSDPSSARNAVIAPRLRVIFALSLELEPLRAGSFLQLIVWLDRSGNSLHGNCLPLPPKRRVIDLRAGDWIFACGRRHRIRTVAAYRDAVAPTEAIERLMRDKLYQGYVVEPARQTAGTVSQDGAAAGQEGAQAPRGAGKS